MMFTIKNIDKIKQKIIHYEELVLPSDFDILKVTKIKKFEDCILADVTIHGNSQTITYHDCEYELELFEGLI